MEEANNGADIIEENLSPEELFAKYNDNLRTHRFDIQKWGGDIKNFENLSSDVFAKILRFYKNKIREMSFSSGANTPIEGIIAYCSVLINSAKIEDIRVGRKYQEEEPFALCHVVSVSGECPIDLNKLNFLTQTEREILEAISLFNSLSTVPYPEVLILDLNKKYHGYPSENMEIEIFDSLKKSINEWLADRDRLEEIFGKYRHTPTVK